MAGLANPVIRFACLLASLTLVLALREDFTVEIKQHGRSNSHSSTPEDALEDAVEKEEGSDPIEVQDIEDIEQPAELEEPSDEEEEEEEEEEEAAVSTTMHKEEEEEQEEPVDEDSKNVVEEADRLNEGDLEDEEEQEAVKETSSTTPIELEPATDTKEETSSTTPTELEPATDTKETTSTTPLAPVPAPDTNEAVCSTFKERNTGAKCKTSCKAIKGPVACEDYSKYGLGMVCVCEPGYCATGRKCLKPKTE